MFGKYISDNMVLPQGADINFTVPDILRDSIYMPVMHNGETVYVSKYDIVATDVENLEDVDFLAGLAERMSKHSRVVCLLINPNAMEIGNVRLGPECQYSGGWLTDYESWLEFIHIDIATKCKMAVLHKMVSRILENEDVNLCKVEISKDNENNAFYRATVKGNPSTYKFWNIEGNYNLEGFIDGFLKGEG